MNLDTFTEEFEVDAILAFWQIWGHEMVPEVVNGRKIWPMHDLLNYFFPPYAMETNRVMFDVIINGPITRYAKFPVAHVPGMPATFSSAPRYSDPDMHHGTCATHVPWCMPRSLTSGFLWSQWRGKHSRHSRRMRDPQFCLSGKRLIDRSWACNWCVLRGRGCVRWLKEICLVIRQII